MIVPFNYKRIGDQYLITNDLGRYAFLTSKEFHEYLNEILSVDSDIYHSLKQNFFLYDSSIEKFIEEIKPHLRSAKSYLFSATSLHIFVVTNYCNARCIYCQAESGAGAHRVMTREIAKKAVDIALHSPQKDLSFEFQGGEPLSNFKIIQYIVEYTESQKRDKNIQFNIVTNLTLLTDEMVDFIMAHKINISTSLDGNKDLHNRNRPLVGDKASFDIVRENIIRLKRAGVSVGAIQTTTAYTLKYFKELIDQYVELGLDTLFIRPLTPLGYAMERWDEIGYSIDEFAEFYSNSIDYMLQYNEQGIYMKEGHASIFLSKILQGYGVNYMELRSPCGASVGQIAYYYDGNIFTCDEGRMLYEMGDDSFKIGNVFDASYDSLMESAVCKTVCKYSIIESLPSCCDCVYQPYCGTCPVLNYALEKDIIAKKNRNYRCEIYKQMLDKLFIMLQREQYKEILRSWIL